MRLSNSQRIGTDPPPNYSHLHIKLVQHLLLALDLCGQVRHHDGDSAGVLAVVEEGLLDVGQTLGRVVEQAVLALARAGRSGWVALDRCRLAGGSTTDRGRVALTLKALRSPANVFAAATQSSTAFCWAGVQVSYCAGPAAISTRL